MKDIFILEGKKYISSRRASEISDYSSDYIGQLCRAERLECKMIGRAWFVTEDSLNFHKKSVLQDEVYRNRVENLKGRKSFESVSEKSAVIETSPSVVPLTSTENTEKLIPSTIIYEVDKRPLLPELKKNQIENPPKASAPLIPIIDRVEPGKSRRSPYPKLTRSLFSTRIVGVAIAIALIIGIGGLQSSILNNSAKTNIVRSSSASIADAFNSAISFIQNSYVRVLAIFSRPTQLSMNAPTATKPTLETQSDPGVQSGQGIAVLPSVGSMNADDAEKQKIQNSFSDEVEIRADKSGTTGVITPVFKNTKSKDFIYVMVPVRNAHSP